LGFGKKPFYKFQKYAKIERFSFYFYYG